MRIVIDMQGAQTESRFRGIGRYTMSLTRALVQQATEHEVYLVLNATMPESIHDIRLAFSNLLPKKNIRVFEVPCKMPYDSWGMNAAECIREDFIRSLDPDIVLISSLFEGHWANAVTSISDTNTYQSVVILYDLIPLLHKEVYLIDPELNSYYFRKLTSLKKANALLAISESSRQEGIQHLGFDQDCIFNISAAVDTNFSKQTVENKQNSDLLQRLGITQDFILYAPGGFDDRKNLTRLIQAFAILPDDIRSQHQLVIAGKIHTAKKQELSNLVKVNGIDSHKVILTDYLEEIDLISIYSLAKLFIFPSLHEGFGLPVLEAMACGTPVIASNTTSIPEIIAWDDALFDPQSTQSISKKLAASLSDAKFLAELKNNAVQRAKLFTWENCASKALCALEHIHKKKKRNITSTTLNNGLIEQIAKIDKKPTATAIDAVSYAINFNQAKGKRNLYLDISTLVHSDAKSGIQRVVRSLLSELLQQSCIGFQVYPIYFDSSLYRYADHFCRTHFNINLGLGDTPVDFRQDDFYLSLDLNMHLTEQTKAIHTFLNEHGVLTSFIVYDILPVKYPEWWKSENVSLFKNWLETIVKLSGGLICISQSVANELQEWIKDNHCIHLDLPPTISTFHLGADIENSLPSKGLPNNAMEVLHKIEKTMSFLMVGTVEPRKGYLQALNAFEVLWQQGYDINLVIVGKEGWLADDLIKRLSSHPQKNTQLYWLQGISDEYLELIYKASCCLIAASEGEGFGLPLIEAAQHKIPIIARNLPVFREVAGDHAFYFETTNPENLAQAIKNWLALHEKKQHPTSDTMPWLTWKESAAQLLAAIHLIDGNHE